MFYKSSRAVRHDASSDRPPVFVERIGVGVAVDEGFAVLDITAARVLVDAKFKLHVAPLTGEALNAFQARFSRHALLHVGVDIFVFGIPVGRRLANELCAGGDAQRRQCSA